MGIFGFMPNSNKTKHNIEEPYLISVPSMISQFANKHKWTSVPQRSLLILAFEKAKGESFTIHPSELWDFVASMLNI